jgi:predicted ATP-dependent endonuclease of OLD family
MRLSSIVIKNFRRIEEADIALSNSTFLIGQNNCGKSSVIRCLELLLSTQNMEAGDFRREVENRYRGLQNSALPAHPGQNR